MTKIAEEVKEKRARPHASAGAELKRARGDRTLKTIAEAVKVSVGRYQNWETGYNRPDASLWTPLSDALGIDVAALYAPRAQPQKGDKMISAKAVAGLVQTIESNLAMLKVLCSETPSTRKLRKEGIHPMRHKKETTAH